MRTSQLDTLRDVLVGIEQAAECVQKGFRDEALLHLGHHGARLARLLREATPPDPSERDAEGTITDTATEPGLSARDEPAKLAKIRKRSLLTPRPTKRGTPRDSASTNDSARNREPE